MVVYERQVISHYRWSLTHLFKRLDEYTLHCLRLSVFIADMNLFQAQVFKNNR